MKKTAILLSILTIISALSQKAVAASSYSWYCMRKKDHVRPMCEGSMSFICEHGGYFLGKDEKVVYLTFDAGYENGNIERILDTLKKHNAHGAFFVLDNIIKRNTELLKRMSDEGHLLCNHTSRHHDMTKMSDEEFEAELLSLEKTAEEYGIKIAPFYRPPMGVFNEQNLICAERMGYKTIFWSLAYADWDNNKQPEREYAKKLILSNIHNGAIILLHPTSKTNADILDDLLCELEREGYRFGELTELSK